MFDKNLVSKFNEFDRRSLMSHVASALLGVTAAPAALQAFDSEKAGAGNKKQVIYLFMTGAMSHVDTFDPKPGSKVQGDTKVINTKTPGIKFGEHMKKLAGFSNDLAVIRGMSQETGAHGPGQYLMRTSYKEIATTSHPGLASWVQRLDGRISKHLPASVSIGGKGGGPGYLGAKYAPVPVGDPNQGLQNVKMPAYLKEPHFNRRLALSATFDKKFRGLAKGNQSVNGYDDLYREAVTLMKSEGLKAFDLNEEEDSVRDKYGRNRLGQGCLLARRLIESGVRFVEVISGGWDMHRGVFDSMANKGPELDNAVGSLLQDLKQKGMLKNTLLVIGTEFGRKPNINVNVGRDHHPAAFSTVLAGVGIKGGQVYGQTDSDAFYVEDQSVSVQDFNATIAKAISLPYEEEIFSPTGRPFNISNGGTPIKEIVG
ncbi:MAG: DUF1501 domain-containing protein [Planctomycetota bacterium]|nr:DUF1501 domain-containing protein [Planctomycetota bacterium]